MSATIENGRAGPRLLRPQIAQVNSLLLALMLTSSAAAAADGYKCNDAGLQQELNACAEETFAAADKELNTVYRNLKASLNKSQQQDLVKDERAWLHYLETTCRTVANDEAEGGSMWPLVFWQCKADQTRERTAKLRTWKP